MASAVLHLPDFLQGTTPFILFKRILTHLNPKFQTLKLHQVTAIGRLIMQSAIIVFSDHTCCTHLLQRRTISRYQNWGEGNSAVTSDRQRYPKPCHPCVLAGPLTLYTVPIESFIWIPVSRYIISWSSSEKTSLWTSFVHLQRWIGQLKIDQLCSQFNW
jgi:hypothetical protein